MPESINKFASTDWQHTDKFHYSRIRLNVQNHVLHIQNVNLNILLEKIINFLSQHFSFIDKYKNFAENVQNSTINLKHYQTDYLISSQNELWEKDLVIHLKDFLNSQSLNKNLATDLKKNKEMIEKRIEDFMITKKSSALFNQPSLPSISQSNISERTSRSKNTSEGLESSLKPLFPASDSPSVDQPKPSLLQHKVTVIKSQDVRPSQSSHKKKLFALAAVVALVSLTSYGFLSLIHQPLAPTPIPSSPVGPLEPSTSSSPTPVSSSPSPTQFDQRSWRQLLDDGEIDKAIPSLIEAADSGDVEASVWLGDMHQIGAGSIIFNPQKALEYYRKPILKLLKTLPSYNENTFGQDFFRANTLELQVYQLFRDKPPSYAEALIKLSQSLYDLKPSGSSANEVRAYILIISNNWKTSYDYTAYLGVRSGPFREHFHWHPAAVPISTAAFEKTFLPFNFKYKNSQILLKINPEQAIVNLKELAKDDHPLALFDLGNLHYEGSHGIQQNMETALSYYQRATEAFKLNQGFETDIFLVESFYRNQLHIINSRILEIANFYLTGEKGLTKNIDTTLILVNFVITNKQWQSDSRSSLCYKFAENLEENFTKDTNLKPKFKETYEKLLLNSLGIPGAQDKLHKSQSWWPW